MIQKDELRGLRPNLSNGMLEHQYPIIPLFHVPCKQDKLIATKRLMTSMSYRNFET